MWLLILTILLSSSIAVWTVVGEHREDRLEEEEQVNMGYRSKRRRVKLFRIWGIVSLTLVITVISIWAAFRSEVEARSKDEIEKERFYRNIARLDSLTHQLDSVLLQQQRSMAESRSQYT